MVEDFLSQALNVEIFQQSWCLKISDPLRCYLCFKTHKLHFSEVNHILNWWSVDINSFIGLFIHLFIGVFQAKIVEELLGFEVIMVSCGASHVLAVTNEHEVFAWGRGHNGRLGLANTESYACPQEVEVPSGMLAKSVHCGLDSTMLLTIEGKLLCCGSNR